MKLPLLPVHILTTDKLSEKIESARSQVQNSHKENRQKINKALSRLLYRNHQLAMKIFDLSQNKKGGE